MIKKYKFNNYISELSEQLRQALSCNKRVILKAPTGAGKTKAILGVFKELSKVNKNHAYILATPNRSQSQQNVKYGVTAVVGGVQVYELTSDEIIATSCVYDKIDRLIEECTSRGLEVTLVIDEAHELIYSYPYRKGSVENIVANLDICKTVIYMTATADVLINNREIFKYDYILDCEKINRIPNAKNLDIIQYDNSNLESLIVTAIKKGINHKHIIVRLNDTLITPSLISKLERDGISSCYIDSQTKDKSETYDFIVNDGSINDKYKVIFVTSLLDSGVSLMNDPNTLCIYAAKPSEFNLNSILQFSNRCRNKYEKMILLVNRSIKSNATPLDVREKLTVDLCKDTFNNLIKATEDVQIAVNSTRAMIRTAVDRQGGRLVPYVLVEDDGTVVVNKFLKAAYIENITFLKVLNNLKSLIMKGNGVNVKIEGLNDDFIKDVINKFANIADKISIRTIKDLEADEEFKEEVKAAKKEVKAVKEEQYMYLLTKLKEVLLIFDKFSDNTQNSYALKILQWLEDPQSLPSIKCLNMYGAQLELIWSDIEDNVHRAIVDDVASRIKNMQNLSAGQEYIVLKKIIFVKKKSDLTGLSRQIQMINFNVNYNLANKDYIKKYSIEFYDLFLIRNRLDKLVQKAKLSDKLLQKLSSELSEKDSNNNITKAYGVKKLANTIKLLYNINSNNQITSIKLKLK